VSRPKTIRENSASALEETIEGARKINRIVEETATIPYTLKVRTKSLESWRLWVNERENAIRAKPWRDFLSKMGEAIDEIKSGLLAENL